MIRNAKEQKLLFSVEKNFEWKLFNSEVGVFIFRRKKLSRGEYSTQQSEFFPFPDFAHNAQTVCRIVCSLNITYVEWHRGYVTHM